MPQATPALPVRLYRRALRLYPAGYRERFGPEMVQVFSQQWQSVCHSDSEWEPFRLILRTLTDLLITSFQQRLATLTPFRSMKRSFLSNWRLSCSLVGGLLVAAAVFGLAVAVSLALPKTYLSSSRLLLRMIVETRPANESTSNISVMQTEMEIIQSALVLHKALDRAGAAEAWSPTYLVQGTLKPAEMTEILRDKLEVRQFRNTQMVEIRVYDRDREMAARLANAIAEAYLEYRAEGAPNHGLRPAVVDMAEPGLRPVRPNIPLNLFVGLLSAGVLGVISGTLIWFLLRRPPSHPLSPPLAAGA